MNDSALASAVLKKLQEMKISQSFHPGTSRPKGLFKALLQKLDELKPLKADIDSADRADMREDMRAAAKAVAMRSYQEAEGKAVHRLTELLNLCEWGLADAVATGLVSLCMPTDEARKATRRGQNNTADDELNQRIFVRASFGNSINSKELIKQALKEWECFKFTFLVIDDWWFGDSEGMHNALFIVRVKNVNNDAMELVDAFKNILIKVGAVEVTSSEMDEVDVE